MKKEYMDCYAVYENNILTIGNSLIERNFIIRNNILYSVNLIDKKTNVKWENEEIKLILSSFFPYENASFLIDIAKYDANKLTDGYIKVLISWEHENCGIKTEMKISDNSPFITSSYSIKGEFPKEKDKENVFDFGLTRMDSVPVKHTEFCVDVAKLNTCTDYDCNTVEEQSYYLTYKKEFEGNFFLIGNKFSDDAILIVKESPSLTDSNEPSDSIVKINNRQEIAVTVPQIHKIERDFGEYSNLYGHTVGVGNYSDLLFQYKNYYRKFSKGCRSPFIMSNTWGGGNKDITISKELVEREVTVAGEIGVDFVQLDDGWQTGTTKNSGLKKSNLWGNGYYESDPDFWKLNKEKFPDELSMFENSTIKPAMWFSPDLGRGYSNYKKDIETILNLYKTYGVTHFKMDGIIVLDKIIENRFIEVIKTLHEKSGGNITFNFDITNGKRFGYNYYKEYGTIFFENRYVTHQNHPYYPHQTLRSLWKVSKYIPSQRLQIEVIDNEKEKEGVYDNFLKPSSYDISYIFAISMVANPLMWMEMCKLSENNKNSLKEIISVYRKERENIADSIISPVGQEPSGLSFTGFKSVNKENGYYILFREMTDKDSYTFDIPYSEAEILFSNTDCDITNDNGQLRVKFGKKGSFVFLKY